MNSTKMSLRMDTSEDAVRKTSNSKAAADTSMSMQSQSQSQSPGKLKGSGSYREGGSKEDAL